MEFGKLDAIAASIWTAGKPDSFDAFVYTTKLLGPEELAQLRALGPDVREASAELLMYRVTISLSSLEEMTALPYVRYVQASSQRGLR